MLPIDWNVAIQYAKLVLLAEQVPPAGDDGQLKAQLPALGYQYVQTLYANDIATDIDPHIGDVVSFGFLAVSPSKELVAAIRGTATIWEWIHDGSFLMVPSPISGASGLTEDGFTSLYRSLRIARDSGSVAALDAIRSQLVSGTAATVTVCGHSLGAALATLLTLDLALNTPCRTPLVYNYASPRVGDHIFAHTYNAVVPSSYRIANRQDIVPKLPPILPLPFEHVNTQYELNPPAGKISPTLPCMHHLTTYLWLMGQLAGKDVGPLNPECVGSSLAAPVA